jgi:hypothetical protein
MATWHPRFGYAFFFKKKVKFLQVLKKFPAVEKQYADLFILSFSLEAATGFYQKLHKFSGPHPSTHLL